MFGLASHMLIDIWVSGPYVYRYLAGMSHMFIDIWTSVSHMFKGIWVSGPYVYRYLG